MYQKKADTKVSFTKSSNDTGSFKVKILHSTSSCNVVSNQDKNCYVTESNQRTTSNAASNTPTPGYSSHADNISTSSTIQVTPKGNTTESNSKLYQNKMASDVIITDNPSYNVEKSNEGGINDSIYIYPSQPSEPPVNKVIEEMPPKQQTVDSGRKECVNTLYSLGARKCNNALYEGLGASDDYAIPIKPYGIMVLTTSQDSYEYVGGQDSTQEALRRLRAESINTLIDRDNVMVSPNPSYGIASLARSTSGSSYNYMAPLQYCEDSTDNVILNRNPSYSVTPLKRSPSPNGYDYIAAKDYEVSTGQAVNVHRDQCSNTLYGTSEYRKAPNGDDGESNYYDMVTSNSYDYVVDEHTVHGLRENRDSTNFRPREYHNALYADDGAKAIPNETLTESQDGYDYV